MPAPAAPTSSPDSDFLAISRRRMMDRIWFGLSCLSAMALPASLARAWLTGWLPVYGLHLALGALVMLIYLCRARLSYRSKLCLLIGLFWSIGLAGVLSFGLLGAGIWVLVMSSFLMSVLRSPAAGTYTALATALVIVLAGMAYTHGYLQADVDANAYIRSPIAWWVLLVITSIVPFIVFQAVSAYQQTILALLQQTQAQRDQIEQLATHDALTGLPTVRLAHDRLQMALHASRRSGHGLALLFVDLDGFKAVNDRHGHAAGDAVLCAVATRLSQLIRASDTAARIGGDEFLLILAELPAPVAAMQIAQRVVEMLAQPIDFHGQALQVGASVGIALYPEHGEDAETLRAAADAAMYAVKRSGKHGVALFSPTAPS